MLIPFGLPVGLILLAGFFLAGLKGWPALRSRLPGRLILPAGLLSAALVLVAAYYGPALFLQSVPQPVPQSVPAPELDHLDGFGDTLDLFVLYWTWVLAYALSALCGVLAARFAHRGREHP